MEQREIGRAGVQLSRVVLGCGNFGGIGSAPELFGQGESEERAFAVMDAAWALGISAFDTADAYGGGRSETAIGKWMRSTGNRPTLTTKTFNPMDAGQDHGLGRDRILRQIESSLGRPLTDEEKEGVRTLKVEHLQKIVTALQPRAPGVRPRPD